MILNTLNFSAACEIEVPGSDNLVITGGHAGISQPGKGTRQKKKKMWKIPH